MAARYQAVKDGKNWRIVDTETGELADPNPLGMYGHPTIFNSRRGLSASSLASRAINSARRLNEKAVA